MGTVAGAVLLLLLALAHSLARQAPSLRVAGEQVFPHIVEYIPEFALGAEDVQRLMDNQFRQITLPDIVTAAYEVRNCSVSLSYNPDHRQVQQISPLEVKVANDSLTLLLNFNAVITHTIGNKTYSCSSKTSEILLAYTKAVDFASGNTLITSFTSSYASSSFAAPTCKETVAKNDTAALADAVNSTKTSSLYLELKKTMDKIAQYLSANAAGERLSQVYNENPYSYDFYGFKMEINVGTIEANPFGQSGIENAIAGTIAGSSFPAVQPPDYEEGFSTFYSVELMKGAIEYAATNYVQWREIRLTRSNMRTRFFAWRLADFEYIVPMALARHPQSYLSAVELQCGLERVVGVELGEETLQAQMEWRCTGSFPGQSQRPVTFISFLVGLRHEAEFLLQESYLLVRVKQVQMQSLQFDYIEDYEVVDPFTAAELLKDGLFEFEVYTFGSFFKIHSAALKKKVVAGRGLWVG